MNTTSISFIGAIALGLVAAVAFAFPAAAYEGGVGVSLGADTSVSSSDVGVTVGATTSAGTAPAGAQTAIQGSAGVTGTAPANPASVKSESDLDAYTSAALEADTRVEGVAYTDEAVEVTYREPGRLLALFPIEMQATARVAADGTVTVSYPWYRFLVASDANADVESALEARAAAWRADAGASFSASAKAELMDEIRAALGTTASASVR